MKKSIRQQTDITLEFEAHEIIAMLRLRGDVIPDDWEFFSVEVQGQGVSKGANFVLRRDQALTEP